MMMTIRRLTQQLKNTYCLFMCGWIIATRSVLVILLSKFKDLSQHFLNKIVKHAAHKILKLARVSYRITYTHPIWQTKNATYIFMSNHQSLMDLPLIYVAMSGTIRFIAKKELFQLPLFGNVLTLSGCIPVDRNNPSMDKNLFMQIKEKIAAQQVCLWIFPEGTRSKFNELLAFKSGGFRLAQEMAMHIVPVGIHHTRKVLAPGSFRFGFNQQTEIRVGKPIDTRANHTPQAHKQLMATVRAAIEGLMTTKNLV